MASAGAWPRSPESKMTLFFVRRRGHGERVQIIVPDVLKVVPRVSDFQRMFERIGEFLVHQLRDGIVEVAQIIVPDVCF